MDYIDGYLIPVPHGKKDEYKAVAAKAAPVFLANGAKQVVECWGDDVPRGKLTDFFMAVKAEGDENVVFSWIVWPSKEVRDSGMKKVMEDPSMQPGQAMPFDGKRMIFGGFTTLLNEV